MLLGGPPSLIGDLEESQIRTAGSTGGRPQVRVNEHGGDFLLTGGEEGKEMEYVWDIDKDSPASCDVCKVLEMDVRPGRAGESRSLPYSIYQLVPR